MLPFSVWMAGLALCLAAHGLMFHGLRMSRPISTEQMQHSGGQAYVVQIDPARRFLAAPSDDMDAQVRSTSRVFEDGQALGPAHSLHDTIRQQGGGLFSHWQTWLVFSSRDGSDPRRNGRTYEFEARHFPVEPYRHWMVLAVAGTEVLLAVWTTVFLARRFGENVRAAAAGLIREVLRLDAGQPFRAADLPLHLSRAARAVGVRRWAKLALGTAAVWALSWAISASAQQPFGWYPDEPGKVQQIALHTRNFFHPQLMLATTSLIAAAKGAVTDIHILVAGRLGSALAASLAAVVLAAAAARALGVPAFAAALAICVSNPAFVIAGRCFKEDSYLLLGLAALIAAALPILRGRANRRNLMAFAAAGAIVCSAKYVGVLLFITTISALLAVRPRRAAVGSSGQPAASSVLCALVVFLVLSAAINYDALANPSGFLAGLAFETRHVVSGHHGAVWAWWSTLYGEILAELNGGPEIALAALAALWALAPRAGDRRAMLLLAAALAISYGLALVWSPVKIGRYVYPVSILLSFMTAVAAAHAVEYGRNTARLAGLLTVGIVLASHSRAISEIASAWAHDTRTELSTWFAQNSEPQDLIVADWIAGLGAVKLDGGPSHAHNARVVNEGFGVYDYCRRTDCAEARYVVVACFQFDRFFRDDIFVEPAWEAERAFFARLLASRARASFGSITNDYALRYGSYDAPCLFVFTGEQASRAMKPL